MKFESNTKLFIHENAVEIVVYEMAAILSRGDELRYKPCIYDLYGNGFTGSLVGFYWSFLQVNPSLVHFVLQSYFGLCDIVFSRKPTLKVYAYVILQTWSISLQILNELFCNCETMDNS